MDKPATLVWLVIKICVVLSSNKSSTSLIHNTIVDNKYVFPHPKEPCTSIELDTFVEDSVMALSASAL